MKKTLFAMAIAAIFVISFSSCGETQTTSEILTSQTKGWVISSGTSEPGYVLTSGRTTTEITDGYLYSEELDDIITFKEGGVQTIDPGEVTNPEYGYQSVALATWSLSEDNTKLTFQIPFFMDPTGFTYDPEPETCRIVSISQKELIVEYAFNDNTNPAKGEYTFTLTYVPAK